MAETLHRRAVEKNAHRRVLSSPGGGHSWKRKLASKATLYGAAGTGIFLVLWELVVVFQVLPRSGLPTASDTLWRSLLLLADPAFLRHIASTLGAAFAGLGLAFVVAVPAGMLLGVSRVAHTLTSTVVELLRPLPVIAFVPLAVLLLGQGAEMKGSIVALGCLWPLLINVIHGVHETDSVAKATGRSFGWSRWVVVRRVVWPSAIPALITGVRITIAISLILCIGAEYIGGSTEGLGSWLLQQSLQPHGMEAVTAGVVIAGALGVVVNGIVAVLDRQYAAWARREDQ